MAGDAVFSLGLGGPIVRDVELVIFDKDGTLMDLYHYWSQMIDLRARMICNRLGLDPIHRAKLVYAMGVDEDSRSLRPDGPVGVKPRAVVMGAATDYLSTIGFAESHPLCDEVFRLVDATTSADPAPLITAIAGVHELFRMLGGAGAKIALATTDITSRGELAMDRLGLLDMMALIVGADQVERPKPAPDMIDLILRRLEVSASHAVMVGDSLTDVQMGLNAGLKASIGVRSGLASDEQLRAITRYVVPDVSHIKVIRGAVDAT